MLFFVFVGFEKSFVFEESVSAKSFVLFFKKEQVLKNIYLLEKRMVLCLFPLDNAILLLMSR